jgi:NAD(P)-dependent dehydrogenase (short-subunit alcohol dehydrogenase family)
MTKEPKTFLITGVSSGLGAAFAAGALAVGHVVVGIVRNAANAADFVAAAPGRAHALELDVTDFDAVPSAVARAEQFAGPDRRPRQQCWLRP